MDRNYNLHHSGNEAKPQQGSIRYYQFNSLHSHRPTAIEFMDEASLNCILLIQTEQRTTRPLSKYNDIIGLKWQ